MMFDLDKDIDDENKIEEIELNCPWTITVPSGASHDFMITKLRWSFEHPFGLQLVFILLTTPLNQSSLILKEKLLPLQNFSSL